MNSRSITRYFILTKRLLRRPGFVAILILIPLMVAAMTVAVDGEDGGILNVALAVQDENDTAAGEIVDSLLKDSGLVCFELCAAPADAVDMVKSGKADAAWIFDGDVQSKIDRFANHAHKNNAFVTVVQREDNVILRFSQEKLNTVLYPYISRSVYRGFLKNNINISELSDQELESFYNAVNAGGADLFEFTYADREGRSDRAADGGDKSFLVSPLRGLLAVMIVTAGIATSMYYTQDDKKGVFAALSPKSCFSFSALHYASAVMLAGVTVLVSLFLSDMLVGIGFELLALLIYCICVTGFCMCLGFILPDTRVLGFAAPVLVIVISVVCPIFITAPDLPAIQYLLPTYYYLAALTNADFLWYMALYAAALFLAAFLLNSVRRRKLKV